MNGIVACLFRMRCATEADRASPCRISCVYFYRSLTYQLVTAPYLRTAIALNKSRRMKIIARGFRNTFFQC